MAFMTAPHARAKPEAVAVRDERGQVSWAELDRRINRMIRAFQACGLKPGDRIALFAGNSREVFELMIAAGHAGLSYVPVNWHFTVDELAYVLQDCEAKGVFTDLQFAPIAIEALRRVPAAGACLKLIAPVGEAASASTTYALDRTALDQPAPDRAALDRAATEGWTWFEDWMAGAISEDEPEHQSAGGPMFYTSGTTGRPKGVVRAGSGSAVPVETLKPMAFGLMQSLQLPLDGLTLLAGPYYHSAQWAYGFQPVMAGISVLITRRFDAAQTLSLIDTHRVTHVHLVPTQFIRLLRLPQAQRERFSGDSLAMIWHGAAPCPPEVKRAMIDWWGPCIHEYYGSTEGSVVTGISSQEWLERPGSVGRATFQCDVAIHRDDGSVAPTGESGTIYMRNRRGVSLRYHNDAVKTESAHREGGWFTTGDVGWLDADDYLHLTDRKIDMIISGGVNIYPAEIEAVLAAHPAVQDVAVIGVPNAEFGEEVKAVIQLTPGHRESAALVEALAQHCRLSLAGYKQPRTFDFRDELPRTETGKLYKRLLRDAYWQGQQRRI
jgi:long-chain acyl-CoA synthetase